MTYRYEMHVHTEPCSGGGAPIEGHIDALIEKGYTGMVVTNHFYNGDNRIDRSLPWEDFVAPYIDDYRRGKAYGDARGFDVLFGVEEHIGGGLEVLVYGISPELLIQHPELRSGDVRTWARVVHEAGGVIYQAHPYRERSYIPKPGPTEALSALDGIEVYNAANLPEANEKAASLARSLGLSTVAGSDGHSHASVGRAGIESEVRIRTERELVDVLKSGAYTVYRADAEK